MTPKEARRRLADARVGRLATVRPDGSPHIVPFVFAVDGSTLYWAVDAKPKRTSRIQRLVNIRHDPRVEILVDHYHEDWTALWWVRASGRARILDREDPKAERVRSALAEKYDQYRSSPPAGPVVEVEIDDITGWAATTV